MPKILFIGAHRFNRSPSQRFRFEQYISFLQDNGFECYLSSLLDEVDDKKMYSKKNVLSKAIIIGKGVLKRNRDIKLARQYDIVFIQREAFMVGTTYFERQFRKLGKKLVFDFDDAIWLPNTYEGNKKFEWLKNPAKTSELIAMADLVFAGNSYLTNYAKKFNKNAYLIPTTIDTDYHIKKITAKKKDRICIGWTGSLTTIQHFEQAIPYLRKLKEKFTDKIYFKVIGDAAYKNPELDIQGLAWTAASEIADLSEFDIGIMPLPDDEWARGKCGLKALQYMALETPVVMSPVGVNVEIVTDGVNGFLASNEKEWVDKLSLLIKDAELRKQVGIEARKTVEERYSIKSQRNNYLSYLKNLI